MVRVRGCAVQPHASWIYLISLPMGLGNNASTGLWASSCGGREVVRLQLPSLQLVLGPKPILTASLILCPFQSPLTLHWSLGCPGCTQTSFPEDPESGQPPPARPRAALPTKSLGEAGSQRPSPSPGLLTYASLSPFFKKQTGLLQPTMTMTFTHWLQDTSIAGATTVLVVQWAWPCTLARKLPISDPAEPKVGEGEAHNPQGH